MHKYKYCPACGAKYDADSGISTCSTCRAELVTVTSVEKAINSKSSGMLWQGVLIAGTVAVLVVMIVSSCMECKIDPNCVFARGSLRGLRAAQEVYQAKWGCYGTATQLGPLGMKLIDRQMAQMTRDHSGEKSGYYFRMDRNPDGSGWRAVAWPTEWGTTGEDAYYVSAGSSLRSKNVEGANPDWNPENYPKRLGG